MNQLTNQFVDDVVCGSDESIPICLMEAFWKVDGVSLAKYCCFTTTSVNVQLVFGHHLVDETAYLYKKFITKLIAPSDNMGCSSQLSCISWLNFLSDTLYSHVDLSESEPDNVCYISANRQIKYIFFSHCDETVANDFNVPISLAV